MFEEFTPTRVRPFDVPAARLLLAPSQHRGAKAYRYTFGWDASLEAFSCNPADGSLAPNGLSAEHGSRGLILPFLSYLAGLP